MEYSNPYLRWLARRSDPMTVLVLMVLLAANTLWAATAAVIASHAINGFAGIVVFAALAIGFNLRWEWLDRYREGGGIPFQFAVGFISAAVFGWIYFHDLTPWLYAGAAVGWFATGCFNVRFQSDFWGQPMVFENRAFSQFLALVSGPVYWAGWAFFAVLLCIAGPIAFVMNAFRKDKPGAATR